MYQPAITRLPSLLCLFLLTLALIGLTELAIRRLPAHDNSGIIKTVQTRDLHPRNLKDLLAIRRLPAHDSSGHVNDIYPRDLSDLIKGRLGRRQGEESPTTVGAPPPSDFLPVTADNGGATSAPAASVFLPVTDSSSTDSVITGVPPSSVFLPVSDSSTLPEPAPTSSVFLPVNNDPSIEPVPSSSVFLPVNNDPAGNDTAPSSTDNLPVASNPASNTAATNTVSPLTVGAPAPTAFLPVTTSPTSSATLPTLSPITLTPGPTITGSTTGSITPLTTGTLASETYILGVNGQVVIDGSTFATASPTTATLADGNTLVVGPSGAVSIQEAASIDNTQQIQQDSITPQHYVLGAFVPIFLAVLFTIPWHILASAIKEIEPFYQLQSPEGAPAKKSLALHYRASITVVSTFTAVRNGHYLVWWSGLVSLIVLFIAPLASETVFIAFIGNEVCKAIVDRKDCIPKLSVYPAAARAIQGILAFVAVLTLGIAIAIARKRSGVYANPLSIAGLATLFQDQRAIDDFRRINGYYSPEAKDIGNALNAHRYRIGSYTDYNGNPCYGLHSVSGGAQPAEKRRSSSLFGGKKYASVAVQPVEEGYQRPSTRKLPLTSWSTHTAVVIFYSFIVAGLLALVVYYKLTHGETPFERFMESESFGVNFLFTAVGVVLKMYWTLLDDDLRANTPYRLLHQHPQRATHSILTAPHNNPFTGLFHSLRHLDFLNAYTSFVAILCEPMIIALANIPFKPGTAFIAYTIATWIIVGVLSLMLIGIVWLLIKRRGHNSHEIRAPESLGGVLWLLCGSHMLGEFQGMAEMGRRERDEIVKSWEKKYSLGSLVGFDGVEREGVDETIFIREEGEGPYAGEQQLQHTGYHSPF